MRRARRARELRAATSRSDVGISKGPGAICGEITCEIAIPMWREIRISPPMSKKWRSEMRWEQMTHGKPMVNIIVAVFRCFKPNHSSLYFVL